jgi:hypothetical protein
MTTPRSVSHYPRKGEFYVWRNPLSLIRITHTEEGHIVGAHQWLPDKEDELLVLQMTADHAEFLWWEQRMTPPEHFLREKPLLVGDVLIARTERNGRVDDGRLLFIGPETEKNLIHVLATWEVCDFDLMSPVYQYGPGHLATIGKTAYDHVLEGAL